MLRCRSGRLIGVITAVLFASVLPARRGAAFVTFEAG